MTIREYLKKLACKLECHDFSDWEDFPKKRIGDGTKDQVRICKRCKSEQRRIVSIKLW